MPMFPAVRNARSSQCRRAPRRGFTLVELLVVIAIIGVLVSLMLPAIQAAREASRRMSCQNNMRQLGVALQVFHDTHGVFPASGWTKKGPGNPDGKFVGWRALILPFIEQQNLRDLYDVKLHWWEGKNLQAATHPVSTFICPSTPSHAEIYSAIAKPPRPALTFDAPVAPTDYEAMMGVQPCVDPVLYATQETNRSVMFRNSTIRMAAILDGTSQTFFVVECAARPIVYLGRVQQSVLDNDQGQCWADSEGAFSLDGSNDDGTVQCLGPSITARAVNATNLNEPYAFHPSGCNVLFADGHVVLMNTSVDLLSFAGMATRAADEIITLP